jgi:hypothetical protein
MTSKNPRLVLDMNECLTQKLHPGMRLWVLPTDVKCFFMGRLKSLIVEQLILDSSTNSKVFEEL